MGENIKNFLYYGISQEIPRKQIINMDILMAVLGIVGCVIENQFVIANLIVLFTAICSIILTFNKTNARFAFLFFGSKWYFNG